MAAEEEEQPVPDSGAIFTFGKSKFADNCPSKFWLKNDKPAYIACGDEHTALVTGNGKLYVFGSNINGQLGIGSGNVITKPTCVKALKSEKIKLAACGRNHTLVSTAQGKVLSSGWNSEGQLGLGDTTERSSFHEIPFFNGQCKIKQLSAGSNTSAVLTAEGKLYMWGENSEGQLGLGNEKNICTPHQIDTGKPISWISCGYYHSAFVTQDGELYTFGEPENGKLGLPAEKLENHKKPQRVPGISRKVKMVSCGGGHTVAVTDKEVHTFGLGQFGQLGQGTDIFETNSPKVIDTLKQQKIRYVACGENHTAVITDKGLLYTFGDGRYGKLGLGEENFTNQFSPTLCKNFLQFTIQSVACGGCHMLVFAVPRPEESELVFSDEPKENYLTVNGNREGSISLQRSPSARVRRREKKHSPEQIRDLTRTLPPLNNNLLESSLPVPSSTVPPNLLKVRQVSSESSAHDSAAASKSVETKSHGLVKSFSMEDQSDRLSQHSFGGTTDILNMTHAVSLNQGNSTFSPVHKRKKNIKNVELKGDGKVEMKERSRSLHSSLSLKSSSYSNESGIACTDAQADAVKNYTQDKSRRASEAGKSKFVSSQEQLNIATNAKSDRSISKRNIIRLEKQISKDSQADLRKVQSGVTSESDSAATSQINKINKPRKHPQVVRVRSHEAMEGLKTVSSRDRSRFVSKPSHTSYSSSSSENVAEKFIKGVSLVTNLINNVQDDSHHVEKGLKCNDGNTVLSFKDKPSSDSTKCSQEQAKQKYFKKKKEAEIVAKQKASVEENKMKKREEYDQKAVNDEKKKVRGKEDIIKDKKVETSELEEDEEEGEDTENEEAEREDTQTEGQEEEEDEEDEKDEEEGEEDEKDEEEGEDEEEGDEEGDEEEGEEEDKEEEGEEEDEEGEEEEEEGEEGEEEDEEGEEEEDKEGENEGEEEDEEESEEEDEEEGEEEDEEEGEEEGEEEDEEESEEEDEEGEEEDEEEGEEEDEEEGEEEEDEEEGEEEDEEEGEEEDEEEGEEEDEEEGEEEDEEEGEEEDEEEGEEEDEEEGEEEEEEEEEDGKKEAKEKIIEKSQKEKNEIVRNMFLSKKLNKETENQKKNVKNIKKHDLQELKSIKSKSLAKIKSLEQSVKFWDNILPQYLTLK
ncbi:X-linked retinitis pigmentosa GTPase regulator isoform X1 [Ranitomeya variabilis]|uniref:X-linked retinitis pigmentosa GTPase regulator isoform X1 n=1 Tax=Ranitomeya variabilis TaxID=490064 RepID=UPI004056EE99